MRTWDKLPWLLIYTSRSPVRLSLWPFNAFPANWTQRCVISDTTRHHMDICLQAATSKTRRIHVIHQVESLPSGMLPQRHTDWSTWDSYDPGMCSMVRFVNHLTVWLWRGCDIAVLFLNGDWIRLCQRLNSCWTMACSFLIFDLDQDLGHCEPFSSSSVWVETFLPDSLEDLCKDLHRPHRCISAVTKHRAQATAVVAKHQPVRVWCTPLGSEGEACAFAWVRWNLLSVSNKPCFVKQPVRPSSKLARRQGSHCRSSTAVRDGHGWISISKLQSQRFAALHPHCNPVALNYSFTQGAQGKEAMFESCCHWRLVNSSE